MRRGAVAHGGTYDIDSHDAWPSTPMSLVFVRARAHVCVLVCLLAGWLARVRRRASVGCVGTTCTVALVTGWLVTVANVGDSSAVLDTGASILELTKSHRLHESKDEQDRLKLASCELAPLGFHLQVRACGRC